jgi:hypothetical protein
VQDWTCGFHHHDRQQLSGVTLRGDPSGDQSRLDWSPCFAPISVMLDWHERFDLHSHRCNIDWFDKLSTALWHCTRLHCGASVATRRRVVGGATAQACIHTCVISALVQFLRESHSLHALDSDAHCAMHAKLRIRLYVRVCT